MRRTLDPIFYVDTPEDVRKAIRKGADVNALDGKWNPAIYYAIVNNNYELFQALLENGADLYDNRGDLSLAALASQSGNLDMVMLLYKYGANINKNCLYPAAENGYVNIVDFLIEHGADVNQESDTFPILGAIRAKNNDIVILSKLIEAGANLNVIDFYGNNPLSMAANLGKLEIIYLLLSHGANICINEYKTLSNALKHHEVFNYLIDVGYNINIRNINGKTLLDEAVDKLILESVIILIKKGADLSQLDESNAWYINKALKIIARNG